MNRKSVSTQRKEQRFVARAVSAMLAPHVRQDRSVLVLRFVVVTALLPPHAGRHPPWSAAPFPAAERHRRASTKSFTTITPRISRPQPSERRRVSLGHSREILKRQRVPARTLVPILVQPVPWIDNEHGLSSIMPARSIERAASPPASPVTAGADLRTFRGPPTHGWEAACGRGQKRR
jgi:hypothetical protein